MLSYPATIPLSSRALNHLAERIRGHRKQRRSRWRRLDPGRQALLVLAHLRNGDTYTRLAAGFEALTRADVLTFADKGYQGARGTVWTPFKRRRTRLSRRQKSVNRHHAKIRALGERAVSTLKTWKILTKLRCCPRRATPIVQAILVLQAAKEARYPR